MCNFWNQRTPVELPAAVWIRFLGELKTFSKAFNISFSGGEPLIKEDIWEILEFCGSQRIDAGICTNGLMLNDENIRHLLKCNLLNVNISIDGTVPEIHDSVRGVPGMLAKIKSNVERLAALRAEGKHATAVIIKTVVSSRNLHDLPKMVSYVKDLGLSGVNFQPIDCRTEQARDMWTLDLNLLDSVIEQLVGLKRKNYPILNSEVSMRQWADHFRGVIPERKSACVVGLRNLGIRADGSIYLCDQEGFSPIGNIQTDNIGVLWRSPETRALRARTVGCERLCMGTCLVRRSLKDYYFIAKRLLES
jgi:radical SAM protein with 4Fe4S-binding SPASM domain